MTAPRGLSDDEAAAWARLAATVTPMAGKAAPVAKASKARTVSAAHTPNAQANVAIGKAEAPTVRTMSPSGGTLDSRWDRKLKAGTLEPEVTLDLHGLSLDGAYRRLMDGLRQARAMDARTILLIAGKERPVDPADRQHRRGAIRAKILDWLAASEFGPDVAAVRRAHNRHGGEGALYLVLKRRRQ